MANLNKVMFIGRLTHEPEAKTFSNGGKVVKLRFVVNNSKKNASTGQWEDDPMYIDVDVFNRGDYGKLADTAEQYLRKGSQVYLEGKLVLETWEDKETKKPRSKHKMVADALQLLGARGGEGGGEGGEESERRPAPRAAVGAGKANGTPARNGAGKPARPAPQESYDEPSDSGDEIPF